MLLYHTIPISVFIHKQGFHKVIQIGNVFYLWCAAARPRLYPVIIISMICPMYQYHHPVLYQNYLAVSVYLSYVSPSWIISELPVILVLLSSAIFSQTTLQCTTSRLSHNRSGYYCKFNSITATLFCSVIVSPESVRVSWYLLEN